MTEMQTLDQENIDANKLINFAPAELKLFKDELDRQLEEGNGIDILKAIRNARYWSEIEKSEQQFKEGHYVEFTGEDWEKFTNDQDCEVTIKGGYKIQIAWDDEAKVWMATSKDIPGLILEDESSGILIQKAKRAAFELMELNGVSA